MFILFPYLDGKTHYSLTPLLISALDDRHRLFHVIEALQSSKHQLHILINKNPKLFNSFITNTKVTPRDFLPTKFSQP